MLPRNASELGKIWKYKVELMIIHMEKNHMFATMYICIIDCDKVW